MGKSSEKYVWAKSITIRSKKREAFEKRDLHLLTSGTANTHERLSRVIGCIHLMQGNVFSSIFHFNNVYANLQHM